MACGSSVVRSRVVLIRKSETWATFNTCRLDQFRATAICLRANLRRIHTDRLHRNLPCGTMSNLHLFETCRNLFTHKLGPDGPLLA